MQVAIRAVMAGPKAVPSKQADVSLSSKARTAKSPQTGLVRARSASIAAAPPMAEGAAAGQGGRPIRNRTAPSALNDFVQIVRVKSPAVPVCDTCKVKPATHWGEI
jgi:hypothetical protein